MVSSAIIGPCQQPTLSVLTRTLCHIIIMVASLASAYSLVGTTYSSGTLTVSVVDPSSVIDTSKVTAGDLVLNLQPASLPANAVLEVKSTIVSGAIRILSPGAATNIPGLQIRIVGCTMTQLFFSNAIITDGAVVIANSTLTQTKELRNDRVILSSLTLHKSTMSIEGNTILTPFGYASRSGCSAYVNGPIYKTLAVTGCTFDDGSTLRIFRNSLTPIVSPSSDGSCSGYHAAQTALGLLLDAATTMTDAFLSVDNNDVTQLPTGDVGISIVATLIRTEVTLLVATAMDTDVVFVPTAASSIARLTLPSTWPAIPVITINPGAATNVAPANWVLSSKHTAVALDWTRTTLSDNETFTIASGAAIGTLSLTGFSRMKSVLFSGGSTVSTVSVTDAVTLDALRAAAGSAITSSLTVSAASVAMPLTTISFSGAALGAVALNRAKFIPGGIGFSAIGSTFERLTLTQVQFLTGTAFVLDNSRFETTSELRQHRVAITACAFDPGTIVTIVNTTVRMPFAYASRSGCSSYSTLR